MAACHLPGTCAKCKETFPTGNALSAHKKKVHEIRVPVSCEDCGFVAPDKDSLRCHRNRNHLPDEVSGNERSYCSFD